MINLNQLSRFLITLVISIICYNSSAQIGLQVSLIKPRGDYGYFFKPAPCLEVIYKQGEQSDHFFTRISLGYYSLKTRQDTFTTTTIHYDGSGYTLLPGYEMYPKYNVLTAGCGAEWWFLKKGVSPFAGIDASVDVASYNHIDRVETALDSEESSDKMTFALIPKVGVGYQSGEKFIFTLSVGQLLGTTTDHSKYSYWKTSLSVVYNFN